MKATYDNPYTFFPTVFKEYNGKKYSFSGKFKKDKKLMKDLKRTLYRNGFYTKIQIVEKDFILWKRKR